MLDLKDADLADGWNGHLPSARQLRALVMYVLTPAGSKRYGARVNAWRVSVGRDPLTRDEIEGVQEMLRWDRAAFAELWQAVRRRVTGDAG